jgi:ATP-binding cassette, subfamily B, bacterial
MAPPANTPPAGGPQPGLLRNVASTAALVARASPALLAGALVCQIADALSSVLIAYIAKHLVDAVVDAARGGPAQPLLWVTIEGAAVLVRALASHGSTYVQVVLRGRVALVASQLVLEKACTIAYPYFENPDFINKTKQVRQEVGGRSIELTTQATAFVRHGVMVLGYAALLWSLGPWVIAVVAATAVPPFLVEVWYGRSAFELQRANIERTRKAFYLEWLLTAEQNVKEIKQLGIWRWLLGRHREINTGYYDEEASLARRRGFRGVVCSALGYAALYATFAYVVASAARGEMSLGSMTLYLLVLQQGQVALNNALLALARAYEHNLFITQLFEYLSIPSEDTDRGFEELSPRVHVPPEIELRGVSFRYPGATKNALADVNLTVRAGTTLALIGPNGSGKTTFVKLLAGLHRPVAGQILLDGEDIGGLGAEQLRRRVGLIFQDFVRYQFNASENVGVGWLPAVEDRGAIREAVADAQATEVLERLERGLDTPLGPAFGGVDLSGGQWQRIALARAFMHRGGVLVLDEPTAALDPEAETAIFQRIHDNKLGRTIILVSHRLSAVRMADQIVVFEAGRIVETGTHDDLLTSGGRYAQMFREQARGYMLDDAAPR